MADTFWFSFALASSVPIVIVGGLLNRYQKKVGIGWQFIRYTVLAISIPAVALLALNGSLTGEAATVIGGAMGYAFGKDGEPSGKRRRMTVGSRRTPRA